jgi:hypothetical protein
MKRISLLLVSIALFSFVALNSCQNQASQPAETDTEVIEEEEVVTDTAAVEMPTEDVIE